MGFRVEPRGRGDELHTTHPVRAQVWPNPVRQASLARAVRHFDIHALDEAVTIGRRLAETSDVIDAQLAVVAENIGTFILTANPGEMANSTPDSRRTDCQHATRNHGWLSLNLVRTVGGHALVKLQDQKVVRNLARPGDCVSPRKFCRPGLVGTMVFMASTGSVPDGVSEPSPGFIRDLNNRGIQEPWVLEAMAAVPRDQFVDINLEGMAYSDRPLPIGHDQTISQPFIVALMAQAAKIVPTDHVLEIGTGSGYGAAILAQRAASVVTVERLQPLAERAKQRLSEMGLGNVEVVVGDGTLGFPAAGPYHAIVVTAAGPRIPQALKDQLCDGGRIVIPVGRRRNQRLIRVQRAGDVFYRDDLGGVRFVPLIGADGRPESERMGET